MSALIPHKSPIQNREGKAAELAARAVRNGLNGRLSIELNEAIAEVVRLALSQSTGLEKLEDALFALEDRIVFELERGSEVAK